nr:MAG: hypothetical protein CM15mV140_200 [Caudoviricetes sp.]
MDMIKLTNGRKIIIKDKKYYEANVAHFKRNGFFPVDEVKKEIKKATLKDISDKVVQLKPKKKKNVKKTKKNWKIKR